MTDILKRLLEAEARAEAIIEAADRERERLVNEALAEAKAAEARFAAALPAIRAPYLREAEQRAEQAVAELSRKYDERMRDLRELAARHQSEAVEAGLAMLLDPQR